MENENRVDEAEALSQPFPPPRRFGFLRLWRQDSAISLALSLALALAMLIVLVAFNLEWSEEKSAVPTIQVTAVSLSPSERADIELSDPGAGGTEVREDDVKSSSSPAAENPGLVDAEPGSSSLESPVPGGDDAGDEAVVDAAVADVDKAAAGIIEARKKSVARKKAAAEAKAEAEAVAEANGGDVPISDQSIRKLFDGRKSPGERKKLAMRDGGSRETEAAVQLGLVWLANHQSAEGRWGLHDFHGRHNCGAQCTKPGVNSNTGATGLALLPFLGSGQTHKSGDFKKVVLGGLTWLVNDQDPKTGAFASIGAGNMYAHGLATIALCEAWALTEDSWLRGPAERAIEYVIRAQSPSGGWRYSPGRDHDTSMIGWQMIALMSGRAGGLLPKNHAQVMFGASRYLDAAQVGGKLGYQYGYQPGGGAKLAMTAEGLLCRQFLGRKRSHPGLVNGVKHLERNLPGQQNSDLYYWYYGTQVMHHYGGKPWKAWNQSLVGTLLPKQAMNGHARGSWPPLGSHDGSGGRVYATALALCMLEVYYRHGKVFVE